MIERVLHTSRDEATAVLRIVLGMVFIAHGAQLLLGWFGGPGLEGAIGYFTGVLGIPWFVAVLVIVAQFFGGLGLIVGLLSRIAAAGIALVMVGAIVTVHAQVGFFMNWFGQMSAGAEGWEFHLLAVAMAVVVVIRGSGAFSLDRRLADRLRRSESLAPKRAAA